MIKNNNTISSEIPAGEGKNDDDRNLRTAIFNYFPKTISNLIGKDGDAQNSVVWFVISKILNWSFFISLLLIANDLYRNEGENAIDILKSIFEIFIPIVTLSLGYIFGKKQNKSEN
ncbi:hypothetical protein [Morganella morganii]|uniref:hypothetical protein n=1 Tax=Morganella morganii TaxID=582 RepID=UPI000ABFEB9A